MPKKPIDYSKIVMYKIIHNDINIKECYIGSTTQFCTRKNTHKTTCTDPTRKNHNLKVYKFIRDNGGWENWNMIEIEKYPCKSNT